MNTLPKALQQVIDAFSNLPGVGPRSAERYAYWCLRHDKTISDKIADSLKDLHSQIKLCPKTFALIDADLEVSPLYDDPSRDKHTVAVVAEPLLAVIPIEPVGLAKEITPVLLITPPEIDMPVPALAEVKAACPPNPARV